MSTERIANLRAKLAVFDQQARQWIKKVPVKARILLGMFLLAAVLMAIHTALTAKDASLHLKLQHGFRSAQVLLWVDDDLAFSGRITGSTKKKFGLIPTDTQQGSLSQIVAVRSGEHKIRVRVQPDDAAAQEDTISGDFASNAERALSVSYSQTRSPFRPAQCTMPTTREDLLGCDLPGGDGYCMRRSWYDAATHVSWDGIGRRERFTLVCSLAQGAVG